MYVLGGKFMKLTFQGVHYKTLFTKFTVQVQDHFLYRFARDIAESDELRHVGILEIFPERNG